MQSIKQTEKELSNLNVQKCNRKTPLPDCALDLRRLRGNGVGLGTPRDRRRRGVPGGGCGVGDSGRSSACRSESLHSRRGASRLSPVGGVTPFVGQEGPYSYRLTKIMKRGVSGILSDLKTEREKGK